VNKDSKKRKDMDSASAEDGKQDDAATIDECATPARKKARFAPAAAAAQGAKNVMEKGRALIDKARLDFLATPKRRHEKPRGAKNAVKTGAKKPTWK
jgi:Fe-S cluster assembly scaffold protein SufB